MNKELLILINALGNMLEKADEYLDTELDEVLKRIEEITGKLRDCKRKRTYFYEHLNHLFVDLKKEDFGKPGPNVLIVLKSIGAQNLFQLLLYIHLNGWEALIKVEDQKSKIYMVISNYIKQKIGIVPSESAEATKLFQFLATVVGMQRQKVIAAMEGVDANNYFVAERKIFTFFFRYKEREGFNRFGPFSLVQYGVPNFKKENVVKFKALLNL